MSEPNLDPAHEPVLLDEILTHLAPTPGETFVDCTAGRGGHAVALARAVAPGGTVIGFDRDAANLAYSAERVTAAGGVFRPLHANFATLPRWARMESVQVDGILADLGFSSNQMDDPARGFSFRHDAPLDMRLDSDDARTPTAAELVATMSEAELADVIFNYGEEPLARKIARNLVRERATRPIQSTTDLVDIVRTAYGPRARDSRMHPATRTFMALRIAVNDELEALRILLEGIEHAASVALGRPDGWLTPGARIGIVSFHSLEDRLVKRCFAGLVRRGAAEGHPSGSLVAGDAEKERNPRSRSARLRVIRIGPAPAGEKGPA